MYVNCSCINLLLVIMRGSINNLFSRDSFARIGSKKTQNIKLCKCEADYFIFISDILSVGDLRIDPTNRLAARRLRQSYSLLQQSETPPKDAQKQKSGDPAP